jgi:DNA-directed RNA polymerase specialized sigma24 family protein
VTEEEWAAHRPAVFGVAYRLLGTVGDAEDVEQDVWLRAASADLSGVRDLRAWLVTVAARRAYDILRSARVRRESYVGPWLPEPLPTGPDEAEPVLVDDSVSTAMLLVMERLSPPERVAPGQPGHDPGHDHGTLFRRVFGWSVLLLLLMCLLVWLQSTPVLDWMVP